jgi:hypothetical protein
MLPGTTCTAAKIRSERLILKCRLLFRYLSKYITYLNGYEPTV